MTTELTEAASPTDTRVAELETELAAERALGYFVRESYADLEQLYREDVGWSKVGAEKQRLTPEGRDRIAELADLSTIGNALIKRANVLRCAYIWGQGVDVSIRDQEDGQSLNELWDAFWSEPTNAAELTSAEASYSYERKLFTRGEAFFALPTDPLTGRVFVRTVPSREVVDRYCNPDDAAEVWLYKRRWTAKVVKPDGSLGSEERSEWYPALHFKPLSRPSTFGGTKVDGRPNGDPIRWDSPMRPVVVNSPEKDWRGLGDVLAALPWAKAHKEFLEDLAVYMRAMTRIVGTIAATNKRAAGNAAAAMQDAMRGDAGQWAVTDPNTSLNMVSKGASIDADSHKPFASMVASATDLPITMLLSDPGTTGARAVAETLDGPTELVFRMRQAVHSALLVDIANYVIDSAVIAPRGPLRGTVSRDGNRLVVTLPESDDRTVDVTWPEYDSTSLKDFVDAVANATELPPKEKFKLLANAFKLADVDELLEELTDEQGQWIDAQLTAAQVAIDAHRKGKDSSKAIVDPNAEPEPNPEA